MLGELFDYVNGVCDPLNPFRQGRLRSIRRRRHPPLRSRRHGPRARRIRIVHRHPSRECPALYTITLADNSDRILVNGVRTSLDEFRGTPYIQADLRVTRPFNFHDRWSVIPFAEFFNLFNRNNPGANYVTNLAVLPVPPNEIATGNVMHICTNPSCTTLQPVTSLNQLGVPGGGLGDFFGPGTTVGIPFAAQLGVRVTF